MVPDVFEFVHLRLPSETAVIDRREPADIRLAAACSGDCR
jgi:hypothetical protein